MLGRSWISKSAFRPIHVGCFQWTAKRTAAGGSVTPQPWFENQVAGGTAFVANSFSRLIRIGDVSGTIQALYGLGRINPNIGLSGQFSTNAVVSNQGTSSYNGLLMTLRKRFSQGLQFDFNYTYSRSIDNQSSIANTVFGGLICDFRNLSACRGNSNFRYPPPRQRQWNL